MQLTRSIAVVTGAGSGLGAVIAEHLADNGTLVLVVDVDADAAYITAERIGGRPVLADVTTGSGREAVAAEVHQRDPPMLLVNNAGGWGPAGRSYPAATESEWREVIELNLLAPMALTQRLAQMGTLRSVVNIASSAAIGPANYGSPEYAVSKAGLLRWTTAASGSDYPVRMNCIVPGWIGLPRAYRERAALPPGRQPELVSPDHIAAEVVRLAGDDEADGQVIRMGC